MWKVVKGYDEGWLDLTKDACLRHRRLQSWLILEKGWQENNAYWRTVTKLPWQTTDVIRIATRSPRLHFKAPENVVSNHKCLSFWILYWIKHHNCHCTLIQIMLNLDSYRGTLLGPFPQKSNNHFKPMRWSSINTKMFHVNQPNLLSFDRKCMYGLIIHTKKLIRKICFCLNKQLWTK